VRISLRLAAVLALSTLVACGEGTPTTTRAKTIGCASDLDCGLDEICADRLCVLAPHGTPPGPVLSDGGSTQEDGGATGPDGGLEDGGLPADGGQPDAGQPDAGRADGGRVDGGADAGVDGGRPDAGTDGGAPRFCLPCSSDAQCGSMKCVTTERTGERFCSPACSDSNSCPSNSACANFLASGGSSYCLPSNGTCVTTACTGPSGCPPETPLCDVGAGRCYRTESKPSCQTCSFSYQCGGFWDRCMTLTDNSRVCGKDCDTARGGTCPSGYRCAEMAAPTGETIRQCFPLTGTCTGCR